MKVIWNEVTLAESDRTVVVEGNHYFPSESVSWEHLRATRRRSLCPWKGIARYYTAATADGENRNAAWSYHHPYPWIRKIRGHVAFWNGVEIRR